MIHKTAIVDPNAKISKNVKIGPYTVIGPNVEIGDETEIQSHVIITGNTKIGINNKIYPFASIGNDPQDLKFKGEESFLNIGDGNIFRENQGGYFQIEAHTNDSAPSSDYLSNRDLTNKMAIAFILEVLKIGTDLSPSRFAAVGWGSAGMIEDTNTKDVNKPAERIEIRWIKRGDDG